jgi:hypothetical protein
LHLLADFGAGLLRQPPAQIAGAFLLVLPMAEALTCAPPMVWLLSLARAWRSVRPNR